MDHVTHQAKMLVSKGAARLDDYFGHDVPWKHRINKGDLDIYDLYACVLGQLFGTYGDGLVALRLGVGIEHGFSGRGDVTEDYLQVAWIEYLNS